MGPKGIIGKYRKRKLSGIEKIYFTVADPETPVFLLNINGKLLKIGI